MMHIFVIVEKDSQLPHIMISYQWDSQSIMVKVKDKLRQAGYKVWMDVEHMSECDFTVSCKLADLRLVP